MAKYFMGGTKYEPYERMMMSPHRTPKFYNPKRKRSYPARKSGKEKQKDS